MSGFRARSVYKRILIAVAFVAVVFFAVYAFLQITARPETLYLHPSQCLGTWKNPQHASGEPETLNADISYIHEYNAALYSGGVSEIYCGGFEGEYPSEDNEIASVELRLYWDITTEKKEIPEEFLIESPEVIQLNSEEESAEEMSLFFKRAHAQGVLAEAQPSEEPSSDLEQSPEASPTEELSPEPSSETLPEQNVDPSPIEEPSPEPSFEPTPEPSLEQNEEPSLEPTIEIESSVEPGSTAELEASPALELSPELELSTEPTPISDLGQSVKEIIPADEVERTGLFEIFYTIDGESWDSLAVIDAYNWEYVKIPMSADSWEAIASMQIKISNLSISDTNIFAYLDGMALVVKHKPYIEPSPEYTPAITPTPKLKTFDIRSKHACEITPFAIEMDANDKASVDILLRPYNEQGSAALDVAGLPDGTSAVIKRTSSDKGELVITTRSAQEGSFSSIVIYEEEQENREFLPNFCQFNLIIE
ncbi:hypothetical protein A2755_00295 [Candidatus Wolfebacteria bacterium RIFCSPHIGHO2_01_FULL_48_22]|uniref:Uncharacterized protein n=1 Tax=Candidatus Wolfebacteria bacterium RIFCSPHIGHO2_01_FULL_48_22 TaxID=1802555 RepID=A0A1F8DVK4_9BACT|nr:MAG: hypothetical protein A2755_00295 [Candidatus Wolfebacteria bacterium RIFCSPHIGHO2_01_FULL_48_22]